MHVDDPMQPSIVGHYIQPPFSVLDRRKGEWRKRTQWWREQLPDDADGRDVACNASGGIMSIGDGVSRFDPTLAEVFYRWWTASGDLVFDPCCGGVTRGLVASAMRRRYVGVDVRSEQVAANSAYGDMWRVGDGRVGHMSGVDAVFTCPPYWRLERYSDQSDDMSAMTLAQYRQAVNEIAAASYGALAENRYIGVVISDARGRDGLYAGLPAMWWQAMSDAGFGMLADMVVLDPVGRKYLTGWKLLGTSRKPTRVHQYLLVGVKGDARQAAARLHSKDMHTTPI